MILDRIAKIRIAKITLVSRPNARHHLRSGATPNPLVDQGPLHAHSWLAPC